MPPAGQQMVTVLFADLCGFTSLVEKQQAANVIAILNIFFSEMAYIINRHGGIVDKFMGDSILAFFPVRDELQGNVLQALQCALEMQIAMDSVNARGESMGLDTLYLGIGVNTGEVMASFLGSDIYREYTVIGKNVNLASRIEAYTLRGQILLSESTRKIAGDAARTGDLNEVNAKGINEPLRFYSLKSINKPCFIELPVRENRKAPRIEITIPISFQMLEGKKLLPEVHEGQVVDISYGGMLINAPTSVLQFSDMKINVSLAPVSQELVEVYAKALFVRGHDQGAEVGLEFTIIDDHARSKIKEFVDHLILL